jgi:formate-dependent nitrite reductase membrane component NrfD
VLLLVAPFLSGAGEAPRMLTLALFGALAIHLVFLVFENLLTSSPTRHHELAVTAIRRGPYARLFWGVALGLGGIVPLALLAFGIVGPVPVPMVVAASLLSLAGAFAWEYVWVDAGQCVPIS